MNNTPAHCASAWRTYMLGSPHQRLLIPFHAEKGLLLQQTATLPPHPYQAFLAAQVSEGRYGAARPRDYLLSCRAVQASFCGTSDRWSDSRHAADVPVLTAQRGKASQKGHVPNGPEVDLRAQLPFLSNNRVSTDVHVPKSGSSLETERNFTNAQRASKHSLPVEVRSRGFLDEYTFVHSRPPRRPPDLTSDFRLGGQALQLLEASEGVSWSPAPWSSTFPPVPSQESPAAASAPGG